MNQTSLKLIEIIKSIKLISEGKHAGMSMRIMSKEFLFGKLAISNLNQNILVDITPAKGYHIVDDTISGFQQWKRTILDYTTKHNQAVAENFIHINQENMSVRIIGNMLENNLNRKIYAQQLTKRKKSKFKLLKLRNLLQKVANSIVVCIG